MLKFALLGATMAMTVPAAAQTPPATPAPAQAAPTAVTAAPMPDSIYVVQETPAPATVEPAPAKEQVASAVDSQFATYDTDGNGNLSPAEFGAWMIALKSQTDPKTDANSPATRKWNQAAFAQADTDKSKSVSKSEIAGFLTPPAKS